MVKQYVHACPVNILRKFLFRVIQQTYIRTYAPIRDIACPPFNSPSVRPTADHDFGRRRHGGGGGGGGAKGGFVCRRICHDDASGGRTDTAAVAAVAKNNGAGACDSDSEAAMERG